MFAATLHGIALPLQHLVVSAHGARNPAMPNTLEVSNLAVCGVAALA